MTTTNNNEKTRPEILTILCILTFAGSGLAMFSNLSAFLLIDTLREFYNNEAFKFFDDEMTDLLGLFLNANSIFFILQVITYALAIYGANLMWNLRKFGFHLYTISQIILLIIPQVLIPELPFPLLGLLISLIFVSLYARNLQYMS